MTLAAIAAVAITLAVVLVVVVSTFASGERSGLDRQVLRSARQGARGAAGRPPGRGQPGLPPGQSLLPPPVGTPAGPVPPGAPPAGAPAVELVNPNFPSLTRRLSDSTARNGEFSRIVSGSRTLASAGPAAPTPFPVPAHGGEVQTVTVHGQDYRAVWLPTRIITRTGVSTIGRIEVAASSADVDARIADLRDRMIVVGLLGLLLAGGVAFLLARVALAALERLRAGAASVSAPGGEEDRLPRGGPREVDDLAGTLNMMLDRIALTGAEREAALAASRRFAGDVGHELRTPLAAMGANLDTLRAHPDIPERATIVGELSDEQQRMAALLEGLQALARADAAEAIPRESVDVAEVADTAVQAARRRHRAITFTLTAPDGAEAVLAGWPDGLRLAIDNLLENAARHGRADGTVATTVAAAEGVVVVTVDDDGPGIPAAERDQVTERFVRGTGAGGAGSGLGLALVAQQGVLHDGALQIGDAPLGGARMTLRLRA